MTNNYINFKSKCVHFVDEQTISISDVLYKIIPVEDIIKEIERNKKVFYIYISFITNSKNEQFYYIGQHSTSIRKRIKLYHGSGKLFKRFYKKYSDTCSTFIICMCKDNIELSEYENFIVDNNILNDKPFTLNLMIGGEIYSIHSRKNKLSSKRRSEIVKHYQATHKLENEKRIEKMRKTMQSEEYRLHHSELHKKLMTKEKHEKLLNGYKKWIAKEENRLNIGLKISNTHKNNPDIMKRSIEKRKNTYLKYPERKWKMIELAHEWVKDKEKYQQSVIKRKETIHKNDKIYVMCDSEWNIIQIFTRTDHLANFIFKNKMNKCSNPKYAVNSFYSLFNKGKRYIYGYNWKIIENIDSYMIKYIYKPE